MGCGCTTQTYPLVKPKREKNIVSMLRQHEMEDFSYKIFDYFTLREIIRVGGVCRYFYKEAGDMRLLKKFHIRRRPITEREYGRYFEHSRRQRGYGYKKPPKQIVNNQISNTSNDIYIFTTSVVLPPISHPHPPKFQPARMGSLPKKNLKSSSVNAVSKQIHNGKLKLFPNSWGMSNMTHVNSHNISPEYYRGRDKLSRDKLSRSHFDIITDQNCHTEYAPLFPLEKLQYLPPALDMEDAQSVRSEPQGHSTMAEDSKLGDESDTICELPQTLTGGNQGEEKYKAVKPPLPLRLLELENLDSQEGRGWAMEPRDTPKFSFLPKTFITSSKNSIDFNNTGIYIYIY